MLEHPHEGNSWGLFQCSYRNKGEQPKGRSRLHSHEFCLADHSLEGRMGPCEILRWVALGHLATSSVPQAAPVGLLLVFKTQDVSSAFLRKFADIMCKPGSLAWVIPENSSRAINLLTCALFWYQDISTWERLSEHITTGLSTDTCSSLVTSFSKAKKYTNIRNLCISTSELHDGNCLKQMYGFN